MTTRRLMIALAMLLFAVAAYLAIPRLALQDPATGEYHAPVLVHSPPAPAEASLGKGAAKTGAAASARTPPAAESAPLQVSLRNKPVVRLGEPLTVTIEVPVRRTLGTVGLTLIYDPRRLHLMTVTKGDLLGGTRGEKPSIEEPNDGIAIIHASTRGASPKAGPGTVLTMSFETLQRGIAEVKVSDVDLGALDATLLARQREARATVIVE